MYNVLFLGRKDLGYKCLRHMLYDYDCFNVVGVMSNRMSDSVWWQSNELYEFSKKNDICFMDNTSRNNDWLKHIVYSKKVTILLSVQHIWIIPKEILDSVNNFAFNLHNAKLPDYKGYNSVNHAILNGDTSFTSTIHRMVPMVDMGDILFEETFPLHKEDTAISLYHKSQVAGFVAFSNLLSYLSKNKELPSKKIDGKGRFYAKDEIESYKKVDLKRDWDSVIERKARAFYFPPFEPAHALLNNRKVYLYPERA